MAAPTSPLRRDKTLDDLEPSTHEGKAVVERTLLRRPQLTRSGPDASARSVGRVARLSRNVGQPDHILANPIISHKAERRPGSGEIWLAVTKHDGVQVEFDTHRSGQVR